MSRYHAILRYDCCAGDEPRGWHSSIEVGLSIEGNQPRVIEFQNLVFNDQRSIARSSVHVFTSGASGLRDRQLSLSRTHSSDHRNWRITGGRRPSSPGRPASLNGAVPVLPASPAFLAPADDIASSAA